jgi:uncharacterized protein with PIN domain
LDNVSSRSCWWSGNAEQLGLGDCSAYAAAKNNGSSLSFKGGDFDKTDIRQAMAAGRP